MDLYEGSGKAMIYLSDSEGGLSRQLKISFDLLLMSKITNSGTVINMATLQLVGFALPYWLVHLTSSQNVA